MSYAPGNRQGVLTVKTGSATAASLHFNGTYVQGNFRLASDGHGGTLILDSPVPVTPATLGSTSIAFASGAASGNTTSPLYATPAVPDIASLLKPASQGSVPQSRTLASSYTGQPVYVPPQVSALHS